MYGVYTEACPEKRGVMGFLLTFCLLKPKNIFVPRAQEHFVHDNPTTPMFAFLIKGPPTTRDPKIDDGRLASLNHASKSSKI